MSYTSGLAKITCPSFSDMIIIYLLEWICVVITVFNLYVLTGTYTPLFSVSSQYPQAPPSTTAAPPYLRRGRVLDC